MGICPIEHTKKYVIREHFGIIEYDKGGIYVNTKNTVISRAPP
jgi:hypothetical protein